MIVRGHSENSGFEPKGPTKKISEHSIPKEEMRTEADFQSVTSILGCSTFVKKDKGSFRCILVQIHLRWYYETIWNLLLFRQHISY